MLNLKVLKEDIEYITRLVDKDTPFNYEVRNGVIVFPTEQRPLSAKYDLIENVLEPAGLWFDFYETDEPPEIVTW